MVPTRMRVSVDDHGIAPPVVSWRTEVLLPNTGRELAVGDELEWCCLDVRVDEWLPRAAVPVEEWCRLVVVFVVLL